MLGGEEKGSYPSTFPLSLVAMDYMESRKLEKKSYWPSGLTKSSGARIPPASELTTLLFQVRQQLVLKLQLLAFVSVKSYVSG